ncbi:MAG TPA: M28 family metallopeptidase [Vicinamibacteria bacterium]
MSPSILALGAMMLAAPPPDGSLDPRVTALLDAVSEERLTAILRKLGGFETRHTLSAADSPTRGIGAAREWILAEMKGYSPRLQVSFDTHELPKQGERVTRDVELRNVMAVLPGKSPRRLYVSGHYDSVARRPRAGSTPSASGGFDWSATDTSAPGVNDDGSGTALTMELARVFAQSGLEFDSTLVFIALAGEEQGLYGARLHAQRAAAEKWTIEAVLNNDIVGNERGGQGQVDSVSVRVFSEGPEDSPSRQLARHIRRQAARYVPAHAVRLIARYDRFGRGGDHSAFNQKGFAAVRFTESKENFSRQHTPEDTFEGVSPPYLTRNARVNAAALAVLALAPPAPAVSDERGRPLLDRGPSGYDARLRWKASPGAAGYRVFWREAWTPDWEQQRVVTGAGGDATELVLPGVSIDDYVFGVAAVSAEGNESLVSAYVNPRRSEEDVETRPRPGAAP